MTHLIDYRVGGMGNTIFAHIIYACNRIELNLDELFSVTGNAHAVRTKYLSGQLMPVHMIECPETIPDNSICIIEVHSSLWYKLLEIKMGYSKFQGQTPNLTNILDFFPIENHYADHDNMWKEFYQVFKDPSWPDCNSLNDVQQLSMDIQLEIQKNYQFPEVGITDNNWVSLLAFAYYDVLQESKNLKSKFDGKILLLDDYLAGNIDVVKHQIARYLKWDWDNKKSLIFQQYVTKNNRRYIEWLDNIKDLFNKTVNKQFIEFKIDYWEKALLMAVFCIHHNKNPRELPWDTIGKLNSNKELITIF